MSCLTQGRLAPCGKSTTGGLKWLYIADRNSIDIAATQATQAVDGSYPSVTMETVTDYFYKFVGKRNTASITESGTITDGNSSFETLITLVFQDSTHEDTVIINELKNCGCGLVVIYCDSSGNTKMIGVDDTEEVLLATVERTTGVLKSDANQTTLTFNAQTACLANKYDGDEASIPVAP
jgi:hypothetical protein